MRKVISVVLVAYASCLVILALMLFRALTPQAKQQTPQNTIRTVAHLDLSKRDGLTLLYKDGDNDVAVYEVSDEVKLLKIGETVRFSNGVEGEVIATDVYGFNVRIKGEMNPGESGTAVFTDYQVGYVSMLIDIDVVRCIWI